MAFASTITHLSVMGNKRVNYGTYANGTGDTGGDIDTGMAICESLVLQPSGGTVIATAPTVNETLPVGGNAVTVITADGEDGYWVATGY